MFVFGYKNGFFGEVSDVFRFKCMVFAGDDFGEGAGVADEGWDAKGVCFDGGVAKAFGDGGNDDAVGGFKIGF